MGLVYLVDGKWKWKEGDKLLYSEAWFSSLSSRLLEVKEARDCIRQACGSKWLEWLKGSRPFFWCWLSNCVVTARDGHSNYIKSRGGPINQPCVT